MALEKKKTILLQTNLTLFFISGLFALWKFSLNPSERKNAFILGYSLERLTLFLVMFLLLLTAIYLFIYSKQNNFWNSKLGMGIDEQFERFSPLLLFGFGLVCYLALFSSENTLGRLAPYREQLLPLIIWMTTFTIQLLITKIAFQKLDTVVQNARSSVNLISLIALAVLLALTMTISLTRIGLNPDQVLWQEPGVPLLLAQVLMASGAGIVVYLLFNSRKMKQMFLGRKTEYSHYEDVIIIILLWGIAFSLWSWYPTRPSYNSLRPTAPNFQKYPFADAMIYDTNAENFLLGVPIPSDFSKKPFYSFFLVVLHGIAEQDYGHIIQLQIAVFATIPALMYLLIAKFGNRLAGLIAAFLAIFRELNALALSNIIQVAHTKLLISDIFTMGLIVLLIWLVLLWLQKPGKYRITPVIVGSVMGFLILTRVQSILLLPVVLLIAGLILISNRQVRLFFEGSIILLFGLCIPMGSWVWHNYQVTGKVVFQESTSSYSYTDYMAKLYSLTPEVAPQRLPGENDDDYYERISELPFTFVREHPREFVRFVSAHYMHNLIYSYIFLPHSLAIENPTSYVEHMPFWKDWQGYLPEESKIFFVFNILILALGTGIIWKKTGKLLFLPVLIFLSYDFSVSVGRLSGWRFILPVDWITLIFYSVGLAQLTFIFFPFFGNTDFLSISNHRPENDQQLMPWSWIKFLGVIFIFITISISFASGHVLFLDRSLNKQHQEIVQGHKIFIVQQHPNISVEKLDDFLTKEGAVAIIGRGLYPVFLPVNEGEFNPYYPAYASTDFKRLAFQLIEQQEIGVVLPLSSRPKTFPNTANVIVIGCYRENDYGSTFPGYIDALFVVVEAQEPVLYTRNSWEEFTCAFEE